MKKVIAVLLIVAALCSAGCSSSKNIDGKEYKPYGLLDADDYKSEKVQYKPSIPGMICGVIFFETIVAPIYIFGFDIMEPVGPKAPTK